MNNSGIANRFNKEGEQLIVSLNYQLSRIVLAVQTGDTISDEQLKKLYRDKLKSELREVIKYTFQAFEDIRSALWFILKDEIVRRSYGLYAFWMVHEYDAFSESVNTLDSAGDILHRYEDPRDVPTANSDEDGVVCQIAELDIKTRWAVKQ